MSDFERVVTFSPAWDKRDADPKKDYGVHCVEIRFVLKGEAGAIQFLLYTRWDLPEVTQEQMNIWRRPIGNDPYYMLRPMPADLGYHWATPRYDDQDAMKCEYLPSGKCYYDGSSLNAIPIYERLLREGDAGVWSALEEYYHELEVPDA